MQSTGAQVPPTQLPLAHVWPQVPQLAGSLVVSVHAAPHIIMGGLHPVVTHWPASQVPVHRWPHDPQLLRSVVGSTQAPPHVMRGAEQVPPSPMELSSMAPSPTAVSLAKPMSAAEPSGR